MVGRLCDLVGSAVRWTKDHYHLNSNFGVGKTQGCFIFDLVSLPLEVSRPIWHNMCTKVALKHQSIMCQMDIPGWSAIRQLN